MIKLINRIHILRSSPYPLIASLNLGSLLLSMILTDYKFFIYSLSILLLASFGWLYEIRIESNLEGNHSKEQSNILYLGFILFLLSEILIFTTLFGAYFYNSIIPSIELFNTYKYPGINVVNGLSLPLLNTGILYFSGITSLIFLSLLNLRNKSYFYLLLTLILSTIFSFIQYYEYFNIQYTILDGIYSTNFFILTGFHGIHVIIGTIFLIYSLIRLYTNNIYYSNKIGIISSILYWAFVDWVWIFLFITIYLY